jgi:hypothetical protein
MARSRRGEHLVLFYKWGQRAEEIHGFDPSSLQPMSVADFLEDGFLDGQRKCGVNFQGAFERFDVVELHYVMNFDPRGP